MNDSLLFKIYEKYKNGTLTDKDWEKLFAPRPKKKNKIKKLRKTDEKRNSRNNR